MNINFNCAINNVSFGYVSYQIMQELWKRNINVNWMPLADSKDFGSFDKAEPEFLKWAETSRNEFLKNYKSAYPTFKLWHIQGGHEQVGANNFLFTFHETDQLTDTEVNILNQQKAVMVSSQESVAVFKQYGVTVPVYYIPLGFDSNHFTFLNKQTYGDDVTTWFIGGKAEFRKGNMEAAKAWVKRFSNDRNHILHLMIFNVFLPPEHNQHLLNEITEGKKHLNVNPLPYMPNLSALNQIYNSTDIVIDMSRGEGWSLPSFNTVALGKHAIVHNCSAMKGWANDENSVLVEPIGKVKAVDGLFFREGSDYNIGNFYQWKEEDLNAAFDKVLARKAANKLNVEGLKLATQFQWQFTVDKILDVINDVM